MTPAQETFLDLLREGMTISSASRRLNMSGSQPYKWAYSSPEFAEAFAAMRPVYRARPIRGQWVEQLIEDLYAGGFVADLDDAGREAFRSCVFRFFSARKLIEPRTLDRITNRSHLPRVRQKELARQYIELKRSGASSMRLHDFCEVHGVSKYQIWRWCQLWCGPKSLQVGPFAYGETRRRCLEALADGPAEVNDLSERLSLHPATVRGQLLQLLKRGQVKRLRPQGARYVYSL